MLLETPKDIMIQISVIPYLSFITDVIFSGLVQLSYMILR